MYTPINLRMYLAAYAGALAGMNASDRIPKNANPAFYTSFAAIAGAWAQSFDIIWNDATAPTVLEVQSVQECSESTWQQRAPQPNVSTLTPASYNGQTAPIAAMIRAADAYMASQGIVPPIDGGGGGGTLAGDVTGPLLTNRVETASGDIVHQRTYLDSNLYCGFGPFPGTPVAFTWFNFQYEIQNSLQGNIAASLKIADNSNFIGAPVDLVFQGASCDDTVLNTVPGDLYLIAGENTANTQQTGGIKFQAGSRKFWNLRGGPSLPNTRSWQVEMLFNSNNTVPFLSYDVIVPDTLVIGSILEQTYIHGDVLTISSNTQCDFQVGTAATATAGGGDPTPATVMGYLTVTVSGTPVRIPYYAP